MIRFRGDIRFAARSVLAGLLILSSARLPAQASVYASAAGSWRSGTVAAGGWGCGDSGTDLIPGHMSAAECRGGPSFNGFQGGVGKFESFFLTSSFASSNNGHLGSSSSVAWFAKKDDNSFAASFPLMGAGGNSTARWDDRAHFLPVAPVGAPALKFMDITFRVHGGISGVAGLSYQDPFSGFTGWIGDATATVAFGGSSPSGSFFSSQVVKMGGLPSSMPAIPEFQTLRIGIGGLVSEPFRYLLSTNAGINIFNGFTVAETFQGLLDASFANTITPVSYSLKDEFGNDVTNAYGVTFEQGLTFESQQSVVPEPATTVLLGLGLAGVAVGIKRRRTL